MTITAGQKVRTLEATAVKENGWWTIAIPEIDAVTATKKLSEVDEYAHSLAAGMLDLPDGEVTVTVTVTLPEDEQARWNQAREAAEEARHATSRAAVVTREVIDSLASAGWSDRDIAAATGLTFQRIYAIRTEKKAS